MLGWPLQNIWLLAVIVVLLYSLWQASTIHRGPLSKIPGPLRARFSAFWMVKQTLDGTQHLVWARLHEKHGRLTP